MKYINENKNLNIKMKEQNNSKLIGKKHRLKIPSHIHVIYDYYQNVIVFFNKITKKKQTLKLSVKIILIKLGHKLILQISRLPSSQFISNSKRKKLKIKQGTTRANIEYAITKLFIAVFCQRMKFIGIGYRAIRMRTKKKRPFVYLRLGYSHYIYINFLKKLNFFCIKYTKVFICGYSYPQVKQAASLIRSYRKPSIYKMKGILYENEKIKLKRGKRV